MIVVASCGMVEGGRSGFRETRVWRRQFKTGWTCRRGRFERSLGTGTSVVAEVCIRRNDDWVGAKVAGWRQVSCSM